MARKKQKSPLTSSQSIPSFPISQPIAIPTANPEMSPEQFMRDYSNTLYSALQQIRDNPYYVPQYANSLMKDINIAPYKPSSKDIENWLIYPQQFEQQLSSLSQYLEGVVMQYERTIYYFSTLLTFNYYLYPITPIPTDQKDLIVFKKSYNKALTWLRKFRVKEQFQNVMLGIIREGGKYYYVRESSENIDLQEMPPQWCVIDGRTSLGLTYAFNMTFFLKTPQALADYAPEFMNWFDDFYIDYQTNKGIQYYKQMPPEKSAVFLFDDTKAARLNPLRSLFKDALDVQEYKKLLKTKTLLDTWKLIYMKSPIDKDGKPSIDQKLIANWIATASASLPYGAIAFGSPLEASEIKVSDNQFINTLGSQTNAKFWENAGVNANIMGSSDAKTASAIKASLETDVSFVSHLYPIFERFLNAQLSQKTGKYKIGVRLFGDKISIKETQKELKEAIQYDDSNYFKWKASMDYEPFEIEGLNSMMDAFNLRDKIKPLMSSHTLSSKDVKNGRPTAEESGKVLGDAGETTIDAGSNIDKIVE